MATQKRDRTPIYGLLFICGLIAVFGLLAFAMSISGWMLFGLVVCLGLVGALILVFQWGYTTTRLMWQKEQNRHVEAYSKTKLDMLKAGYNPDDYTPITRQIAAPVEPVAQIAEPAKGVHFTSASVEGDAANLLLFTINLLGRNGNRIASNPECAAANMPGYNARKWDAVINKYLKGQLGIEIATQAGPVANGGGAFVPPEIGTVGALYDRLVYGSKQRELDDAVMSLQEAPRSR